MNDVEFVCTCECACMYVSIDVCVPMHAYM